jgi:hypothetical protein
MPRWESGYTSTVRLTLLEPLAILEFCNTLGEKKQYDVIFLNKNLIFFI